MNFIDFYRNSKQSVSNPKLQNLLKKTIDRFRFARLNAISEVDNWEQLREKARKIKEHTISNLDFYLLELEKNVLKRGGKVHWARSAEEARKIIIEIATQNRVRLVVKSKSMTTEEIELNKAFEKEGISSVETDLGEYILQLSEESPSHIIVPAIHKSEKDISKLFSKKFGISPNSSPEILTYEARKRLREKFLSADMGVSGVNFAVSETGTIVIVENEGNARLTTTIPPIHVAISGIEKVIPRLDHLSIFLSLLPRSATGQKSSTYVSLINGPKRNTEKDGPSEFHLILLDNGRSKILSDPELKESLYCIRCGACLNICPVYRQTGGHSYGWVYSGPIGILVTSQLLGLEKAHQLPFASSLCGACKDVCPVKIDFPKALLNLRKKVKNNRKLQLNFNNLIEVIYFRIWKHIMKRPRLYRITTKLVYRIQQTFFPGKRSIEHLPYPFSGWTKGRNFPRISNKSFRQRWEERRKKDERRIKRNHT